MRKNTLTRQVRRAYSQDKLARICTLREDRFGRAFGMETVITGPPRKSWGSSGQPEDYYHFRDNGGRVLAVAHLDTVVRGDRRTPRFRETKRGPVIGSGALDDRLGAYVILDLLPKMGISCDWLFTVGEESGQSTAGSFEPPKAYDHVIEFDRGGTDVVMYQYEDRASRRLVEAAGADVGQGSFSDIAYLEQLNVKCFNWGVGYRGNYHSERGYAYLHDTFAMVAKYARFHEQNAGVHMPHEPEPYLGFGGRSSRSSGTYDEYYRCDSCGERAVDSVTWYCTFCGVCADCGAVNADIAAEWNDPDVDVCQCYTPARWRTYDAARSGSSYVSLTAERLAAQDEAAEAGSTDVQVTTTPARQGSLKGLTWEQYLAQRPGAWSDDNGKTWHSTEDPDDSGRPEHHARLDTELNASEWCLTCEVLVNACTCGMMQAYRDAQAKDEPGGLAGISAGRLRRSPSLAPPWSEHRVSATGTGWANGSQGAAAQRALTPGTEWHEIAVRANPELADVRGHAPDPKWALECLRCAARWPHKLAGDSGRPEDDNGRDRVITAPGGTHLHAERDCPGCERCQAGEIQTRGQRTIHVIPAHFPGVYFEDSVCTECNAMERVFPDADLAAGPVTTEAAATAAVTRVIADLTAGELSAIDR